MDALDFQILQILNRNARTPFIQIAKALNLTSRTIILRIKAMQESQIISHYSISFDYGLLNLRHYTGCLQKTTDVSPELSRDLSPNISSEKLKEKLQSIHEISHIWQLHNDLFIVSFFCQNSVEIEHLANKFFAIGLRLISYSENISPYPKDIPLSILDWKIIRILYRNSRESLDHIATLLSVNLRTILRRMARLEHMMLIHFIPFIAFKNITGYICGVIFIETIRPSHQVFQDIQTSTNTNYFLSVNLTTPSLVLFIYGESIHILYQIHTNIKQVLGVKSCELFFIVDNWENSDIIYHQIQKKIEKPSKNR